MSLDFRALQVGALQANCYVVWDTETKVSAIIDPGGNQEDIFSLVESMGLDVQWVLLTHGHFDHEFCTAPVAEKYGAKIGMQALDVEQATQSLQFGVPYYDPAEFTPFTPDALLDEGDAITLGSSRITVLHTPGHSQGGLCFVSDAGVFCGDTIFAGSVGRWDFPGGSHSQLMESIHSKIMTMDDSIVLFPGHGPGTTVGDERKYNEFI